MKRPAKKQPPSAPAKSRPEIERHENLERFQQKLRATQGKLRRSKARYAELFDLAPVAYVALDPAGTVTEINKAGTKLLGKTAIHIRQIPLRRFVVPEDRGKFDEHLKNCRLKTQRILSEIKFVSADGRIVVAQVITSPLRLDADKGAELLTSIVDISELKHAERELELRIKERDELLASEHAARLELEQANRAKDEFPAMLSHELRTPLMAILGWAQMLKPGKLANEDLERASEIIQRNALAQVRLINDLLDMNQISTGKLRLQMQEVDLGDVLDAAVNAIQPFADTKNIRLSKIRSSETFLVRADPARIQQIITNLLTNAVKFTPSGGRVTLTLGRAGSQVEITITDSGIGISPEFLPNVFDRFTQRDSSATRQHGGLGLGLTIVKQLVELHKGTVKADSEGDGKGAKFCVSLPALERTAPSKPVDSQAPVESPSDRLNGVNILVVEDEADARNLVCRALHDAGARVQTAGNATEGLRLIKEDRFEILVSDIAMPGMDGCEFLRQLRKSESHTDHHVSAVALTAHARPEDHRKVLEAGFDQVLTKPIEIPDLVSSLVHVADERRKT